MKRIGVDIGGTFTDIVALDEESGDMHILKIPSTPESIADAPIEGLEEVISAFGVDPRELRFVSHGTTVGTNTVIQRSGAKTGLITTKGFRDVLELGRVARPAELLYDIHQAKPDVLVPRYLRREIGERTNYLGQPLKPVEPDEVRRIVRDFLSHGVESIAVALLFSYIRPSHEIQVSEIINAEFPNLQLSLSSRLSPFPGEYERTSTTAVDAYIKPVFSRYLELLEDFVVSRLESRLYVMQSNGGLLPSSTATEQPVRALESGPVAGVVAASYLGGFMGISNIISFDMGGTTAKAGLIIGGNSVEVDEYELGGVMSGSSGGHLHGRGVGFPIRLPAVEVAEVGSGGGSVGWIDSGGAFKVGPRSMGARPGPACYGLGGDEPTVTDAQLVLGVINPANFLGGKMKLTPELSHHAIEHRIASPLSVSVQEAARGLIKIVNSKMAEAIRLVSVKKGHDPRDFVLMAFGGAGPMHAWEIARELEIPWVIIPRFPGIHSALGLVVGDILRDFNRTVWGLTLNSEIMTLLYRELEEEAWQSLDEHKVPEESRILARTADVRYRGQGHTVNVPVPSGPVTEATLETAGDAFHSKHEALYSFRSDEEVEFVNLRLRAIGSIPRPSLKVRRREGARRLEAWRKRAVFFEQAGGYIECLVFDRTDLLPGCTLKGPAVVEQEDTTILIHPDTTSTVDDYENLIIGEEAWNGRRRG